jgi:hypothetical protein
LIHSVEQVLQGNAVANVWRHHCCRIISFARASNSLPGTQRYGNDSDSGLSAAD